MVEVLRSHPCADQVRRNRVHEEGVNQILGTKGTLIRRSLRLTPCRAVLALDQFPSEAFVGTRHRPARAFLLPSPATSDEVLHFRFRLYQLELLVKEGLE